MTLTIHWEALQSYIVQERTREFISNAALEILNRSDMFSSTFSVDTLSFGSVPPTIEIISMKDVDVTLQWHLKTHEYNVPGLPQTPFKAPFQATIKIEWQSNGSFIFSACPSLNVISPGCVKFPISASLSEISFNGKVCLQYLGDSLVVFFEQEPEFNFQLELSLGADEKVFDKHQVRGLVSEVLRGWISENLVSPNAVKFPFEEPHQ